MTNATAARPPRPRVPTGVKGLDVLLQGGLFRGGLYVVTGQPGSGKTILGNEICFRHVAAGGRAVLLTLLVETHSHMLEQMQQFDFFDPAVVGDELIYLSGYEALVQRGLQGLLELIRQVMRDQRATVLVIDGLSTAEEAVESDLGLRRFLQQLQVVLDVIGCTTVLVGHIAEEAMQSPLFIMADGVITLRDELIGRRALRDIEVRKFRGSHTLRGRHVVTITDGGVEVHPRTEAVLAGAPVERDAERVRLDWGIPTLNEMTGGGVLSNSTTLLLGASGTGKTLLGLQFLLGGIRAGEPSLYFSFSETPQRTVIKAAKVGMDLATPIADGLLEIVWQPPLEEYLDVLAERLLDAVTRRNVRRLFIDEVNSFEQAAEHPERLPRFFAALTNELRSRHVTTCMALELRTLFGPTMDIPRVGVSAVVENLLLLRSVEYRSQLYRLLSIIKLRESGYDPAIHEFTITPQGIEIAGVFQSAQAILTGVAQPLPPDTVPTEPDHSGTGKGPDADNAMTAAASP